MIGRNWRRLPSYERVPLKGSPHPTDHGALLRFQTHEVFSEARPLVIYHAAYHSTRTLMQYVVPDPPCPARFIAHLAPPTDFEVMLHTLGFKCRYITHHRRNLHRSWRWQVEFTDHAAVVINLTTVRRHDRSQCVYFIYTRLPHTLYVFKDRYGETGVRMYKTFADVDHHAQVPLHRMQLYDSQQCTGRFTTENSVMAALKQLHTAVHQYGRIMQAVTRNTPLGELLGDFHE